jgi:hypothetical protein
MYAAVVHFMNSTQVAAPTVSANNATSATMIEVTSHHSHSALPGIGMRAPVGHCGPAV